MMGKQSIHSFITAYITMFGKNTAFKEDFRADKFIFIFIPNDGCGCSGIYFMSINDIYAECRGLGEVRVQ